MEINSTNPLIRKIFGNLFTASTNSLIPDGLILKGMQCKKLYWLEQHAPEKKRIDISNEALKAMIKSEVELTAKGLFPDAYVIRKRSVDAAIKETKKAIAEGKELILDAMVAHEGVVATIDVLKREEGAYSVYEIKSSSGVKDTYFNEAALKWNLLVAEKVPLYRSYLVHINSRYTRRGELDIKQLFATRNITQVVKRRQEMIVKETDEVLSMEKEKPKIHIGSWCNDPYPCDYSHVCWKDIPKPSVFDLHMLPGKRKFELYRQGIVRFEDIPDDLALRPEQREQIEAELYDKEFIDKKGIGTFLSQISYPVHFLDFETYQQAVPRYDNLRPYEQIPFQFSLHIIRSEGAEPEHVEFLGDPHSDPRAALAAKLAHSTEPAGSIIAYNQSFEKGVIKRLAENNPEHAAALEGMLDRFVDLMYPFERRLYYNKVMNGRHSIKTVLPAMVPELSYALLDISHGGEAMNAYSTLHLQSDKKRVEVIRHNLLEYCKLDTLGMVEIWKKLKSTVSEEGSSHF